MDELTIGNKTYISSKQAAKITGYAKDYVGQLCREGRVEARLVGRNWYVLEASIREHRFGAEQQVPDDSAKEAESKPYAWTAPTYVSEEPVPVPALAPKEPEVVASRKIVSEMQTAWQEWFTKQTATVDTSPSAEESVTPEPAQEAPAPEPLLIQSQETEAEQQPEALLQDTHSEEEDVPIHTFSRVDVPAEARAATGEVMDLSSIELPAQQEAPAIFPEQPAQEPPYVGEEKHTSASLRVFLIGCALIAAVAALVGTGVIGDIVADKGYKNSAVQRVLMYLGGESQYINSK